MRVLQLRQILTGDDAHYRVVSIHNDCVAKPHCAKVREHAAKRATISDSKRGKVDIRREVRESLSLQQQPGAQAVESVVRCECRG